ncbi:MAG: ABC transporter permease [Actinomycetes bacterium]|jgi:ribose transport system permease protein
MTTLRRRSSLITQFVVASRYMPVFIAIALLAAIAAIWVPDALAGPALRAMAAGGAILAIAALGQMLVVMTAGIDMSTPGTVSMAAVLMVGMGNQQSLSKAIFTAIGMAVLIGLVNGILIGGIKLNALIVTLATGQLVNGLVIRYSRGFPVQLPVPEPLSSWTSGRILGQSHVLWVGVLLTVLLILGFRYTTLGRRFQSVGANPVAAHVVGLRVNVYQIAAYVVAAVLYAVAGILLAGQLKTPGVSAGQSYLLGPIAAVVIGGASLTGGLASSFATASAAFFITWLNQVMRVLGLSTALQNVVFGAVIIAGMLISGDRIIRLVERVLRERRRGRKPGRNTKLETSGPKSASLDGGGT